MTGAGTRLVFGIGVGEGEDDVTDECDRLFRLAGCLGGLGGHSGRSHGFLIVSKSPHGSFASGVTSAVDVEDVWEMIDRRLYVLGGGIVTLRPSGGPRERRD